MSERPTMAILGASGFIGSRLVEWLLLRDLAAPRPIVRSFRGMARLARFDLDCRLANATDSAALVPHLKGCEVLFHCAVGGRDVILKSAEAAYRAADAAGVKRLVYLSSAVVHGHDPATGTDDETPLITKQPFEYNVSKVMAEHLLRRLRGDGKVEVVTLRPSIVFGPRSQYWTAQIATDLLAGKAFLVDAGSGVCNTVFVDNLVEAVWLGATVPEAASQDFIVTDGERVTWRDLYAAVAKAVGVDMSSVASISIETAQRLDLLGRQQQLLQKLQANRFAQIAKHMLPYRLKRMARVQMGIPAPEPTLQPKSKIAAVDSEISSLQRCRYVLPVEKARRVLGYKPEIGFAKACERTAAWLRFASGLEV